MGVKGGASAPRANVALTPKGAAALAELQARMGLAATDVVNRALQLYADLAPYVEAEGGRCAFIQEPDGEQQRLRVL